MNNCKFKKIVVLTVLLLLSMISNLVLASEVTGNLSTGIGGTVTVIDGIVMVSPTASPVAGTYKSIQSVTLSASGSLSIHYTINGIDPTCSTGTVYAGPISVNLTQTIKSISCYQGSYHSSVASSSYVIDLTSDAVGTGGGYYTTIKKGDFNNDGKVDKYDFSIMMANWGKTGFNICDLNNDGKVDKYDFSIMMSNWSI